MAYYLLTIKKENYILLLWRKCSLKLDSNKSGFWKTHFTACLSVYLYLLKSMFLFQWYFRVPKLRKIVPTHSPKRDFIIFTVSENSFQNILIFFASNWKISISGAKFFILFIVPQKCTQNWPVIYWPAKEIHITKKPTHWILLTFCMKLNDNEYSKVTGAKFWKKILTPLLGFEMTHLGPKKAPSLDFFFFGIILEPIEVLKLGQISYFQKCLFEVTRGQKPILVHFGSDFVFALHEVFLL